MIYFFVTTCIFNDSEVRKNQYFCAINKLKQMVQNIESYKIIIIENNGFRDTYLDCLGCEVFYTNNNSLLSDNKGYKELQDIFDCIDHYNVQDSDFIVKMTGRYILDENSEFINICRNLHNTKYDCVIKYGPYFNPVNYKTNDCITGLIGMSCLYVKLIQKPDEHECVEWKWGEVTNFIEDSRIFMVDRLGIHICPGCDSYFFV